MNQINDKVIQQYKPTEDVICSVAENWPLDPDMKFSEKKMRELPTGSLPPHNLYLKPGCVLMLLRNWRLSDGILCFIFLYHNV